MNYQNITNIQVDGIDTSDAPDFCDAFICYAEWKDTGIELTEAELEKLNDDGDFRYECVMNQLY